MAVLEGRQRPSTMRLSVLPLKGLRTRKIIGSQKGFHQRSLLRRVKIDGHSRETSFHHKKPQQAPRYGEVKGRGGGEWNPLNSFAPLTGSTPTRLLSLISPFLEALFPNQQREESQRRGPEEELRERSGVFSNATYPSRRSRLRIGSRKTFGKA